MNRIFMHFITLFLLLSSELFSFEYELGQGINIPQTPIYVGGYATLDYLHREDDYSRFRVDELALLSYASYNRFSFMGELLYKESYVKEWGKVKREKKGTPLTIERLYLDYRIDDALTLRAGKFNTPVGYWNLEPISVLRDSASNPYLAYIIYPRYTTGILLTYADTISSDSSYTLIAQENSDLDDNYNNISVKRHYALGYEYRFDNDVEMKLNLGHFMTTSSNRSYYGVVSLQYDKRKYKINSEFALREGEVKLSVPYSFYLQGVYKFQEQHNFIARYETYKIDEGSLREEQIGVFGYTYRPIFPLTFKLEYQLHSYTNENQFHAAISVMF